MSIRFINLFTVPAGRDDQFFELWREVNVYMAAKPGYLNHRLHRAVSPDAPYRFVNYVEWESPEAWSAAHDAGFRELVGDPRWSEFTTTPALYEIVHEGAAPAVSGAAS